MIFHVTGTALSNGFYSRQTGNDQLPVYTSNTNALWLEPEKLTWMGGLWSTYQQKAYTRGSMFSQLKTTNDYCPENLAAWRQYKNKRWMEYEESTVNLKCLSNSMLPKIGTNLLLASYFRELLFAYTNSGIAPIKWDI